MIDKKIILLTLFSLLLLAGCSRGVEATPEATRTPEPPPFGVTYCDINPSDLCLEGFGLEGEDKMLILFKADDRYFANIYIRVEQDRDEVLFECRQSKNFIENVYCHGDVYPEDEKIRLNIHSKSNDKLIAEGVFFVQFSALPEPDVEFGIPTPNATVPGTAGSAPSSTPEPAYPNYPNSSYPN